MPSNRGNAGRGRGTARRVGHWDLPSLKTCPKCQEVFRTLNRLGAHLDVCLHDETYVEEHPQEREDGSDQSHAADEAASHADAKQVAPRKGTGRMRKKPRELMDIIWAKLTGYSWWPALVCAEYESRRFKGCRYIHVQFFGPTKTSGWVIQSKKTVADFVGREPPSPPQPGEIKEPYIDKAIDEAMKALRLERSGREALLVTSDNQEDHAGGNSGETGSEIVSDQSDKHEELPIQVIDSEEETICLDSTEEPLVLPKSSGRKRKSHKLNHRQGEKKLARRSRKMRSCSGCGRGKDEAFDVVKPGGDVCMICCQI